MKTLKTSNNFSCFIFHMNAKGNLEKNYNNACFAGISSYVNKQNNTIYIKDYEREETIEYAAHLVMLVNRITPCELVTIKGINYIKFELLKTYDQNLLVLNFVRNLWYSGCKGMYQLKKEHCYSVTFFKKLITLRSKDVYSRITLANKYACTEKNIQYCPGHSNINKGEKLKVKTTAQLLAYKGNRTETFLTT